MHIETLELSTDDLNRMEAFYGQRLGLPVDRDDSAGLLTVTVGLSMLVFRHNPGFIGCYHFACNIPENRAMAARTFLEARDIVPIPDPNGETLIEFSFWDADAVYFYDPAGNIGEFIARHELPNAVPDVDPFSAAEILNISEIGLPSEDIAGLATLLGDKVKVTYYRASAPEFMPYGDANGLSILVPEGRPWYPDARIPAEALPVRVVVRNEAGERFTVEGLPYQVTPL